MNINDVMVAAIQNPELLIELKHRRNELAEKLNKNGNVLSEDEKKYTQKAIAALDQFIWAMNTSDDPAVVRELGKMFKDAKKMADSGKYSNDEIADYCIAHSQAEIMPLFITEFPKIYSDAEYDKMVNAMQLLLDKAYADIDYQRLTAKEMVAAVLTALR